MTLHKATLQEVDPKAPPRRRHGSPIGAGQPDLVAAGPRQQHRCRQGRRTSQRPVPGPYSSTLSFDLMFDTADEGTTAPDRRPHPDRPAGVLPAAQGGRRQGGAARVKFVYGSLEVVGSCRPSTSSSTSSPTAASRCGPRLGDHQGTEAEFDADLLGPGANTGSGGGANPLPGPRRTGRAAPPDRTGTALGGEAAADFATRMGLDPSTWKQLADGISDPLRLDAGLQIDFSASVSLGSGLGVTAGGRSGRAGRRRADPRIPAAVTAAGGSARPCPSSQPAAAAAASPGRVPRRGRAWGRCPAAGGRRRPRGGVAPPVPSSRRSAGGLLRVRHPASTAGGRPRSGPRWPWCTTRAGRDVAAAGSFGDPTASSSSTRLGRRVGSGRPPPVRVWLRVWGPALMLVTVGEVSSTVEVGAAGPPAAARPARARDRWSRPGPSSTDPPIGRLADAESRTAPGGGFDA